MQSATLFPNSCCLLEGCIRLAWRSIGDGFPVADAEVSDGGGTECEGASTLSACTLRLDIYTLWVFFRFYTPRNEVPKGFSSQ